MITLAGQTASLPEVVAFAAGLLSVWFARGMHIATWPLGIVSVLCFSFVFLGAKLYADALLQLAFVAVSAYGWWSWSWSRSGGHPRDFAVTRSSPREIGFSLAVCALVILAFSWLLRHKTDSPAPWADAAIFGLSLLAIWAQARKRVECWVVWIAVDLIAIPLYWSRSLALSAGLYLVFLLLCIAGLAAWQRRLPAGQNGRRMR